MMTAGFYAAENAKVVRARLQVATVKARHCRGATSSVAAQKENLDYPSLCYKHLCGGLVLLLFISARSLTKDPSF